MHSESENKKLKKNKKYAKNSYTRPKNQSKRKKLYPVPYGKDKIIKK